MNNDLISREALREDLRRFFPAEVLEGIEPKTLFAQIMHDIDNAPTVSLQDIYQEGHYDGHLEGYTKAINEERPQGEWITKYDNLECPFCGMSIDDEVHWLYSEEYNFNFCPNCGASMMRGETDDG